MDIISAYREAGTYWGAAAISGTSPKTVKRVIARHEAGGGARVRSPRVRNYDAVTGLVAERVDKTSARISAKRLLPAARAAGYSGSPRNLGVGKTVVTRYTRLRCARSGEIPAGCLRIFGGSPGRG